MTTSLPRSAALRDTQRKFIDAVIDRYETGEWWRFSVHLTLVVGGGVITGLGRLETVSDDAQNWLTGIGLGMVFLGGVLVAIFDRQRASLTTSARNALDHAQTFLDHQAELEDRVDAAIRLDVRRRHLLLAQELMQEAVERMPHGTDLEIVVGAMLDAGINELEGAIGFDPGEKWAFSIFRRVPVAQGSQEEVMRRLSVAWADRFREMRPGREWCKNEGFTGVAWQREQEVVEADATVPEVAAQYRVPDGKQHTDDDRRYVSVAVIPIRVGTNDEIWGCVTATSDQKNRWRRNANDPREQNVRAVRALAQLIAMQVALRDGSRN